LIYVAFLLILPYIPAASTENVTGNLNQTFQLFIELINNF